MNSRLRVKVSKYMSYLLRHNPKDLKIDEEGFVCLDEFLRELREKYNIDERFINEIVNQGVRKRFEIIGDNIRAMYGHSIEVNVGLEEDGSVAVLYHGTTPESASKILKVGLKPMNRKWVHLSPAKEIAIEVGRRRTSKPIVLVVNAKAARRKGLRFFRAIDRVFVCKGVPPEYIKRL